jgi:hypothetical protein
VLNKQLGHQEVVNVSTLRSKWRGICLDLEYLDKLLKSGNDFQMTAIVNRHVVQVCMYVHLYACNCQTFTNE